MPNKIIKDNKKKVEKPRSLKDWIKKQQFLFTTIIAAILILGNIIVICSDKHFEDFVVHGKPFCVNCMSSFSSDECTNCGEKITNTGKLRINKSLVENATADTDTFTDIYKDYADYKNTSNRLNTFATTFVVFCLGYVCTILVLLVRKIYKIK